MGRGWFGRVIASEAASSPSTELEHNPVQVVVRALDAGATPDERKLFLQEARIYYESEHLNVMPLHGKCLELAPLLLIQPYYGLGDVKKYLLKNKEEIIEKDNQLILKFATQLTNGLVYLFGRGISHP